METEDNYYLHRNWKKPKIMTKMKGIIVSSVAWDRNNTDLLTTNDILIGTTKGRIFETSIEANDKAFMERLVGGGKELSFKPIYYVGDVTPIFGLKFEKFATTINEPTKYYVMVTTTTRIYQFIGGPTFENVFNNLDNGAAGFQELPGDLNYSKLLFYGKYNQGLPKSFAWLTGPGIYTGDLIFGSQIAGESVMTDTNLFPYPNPANIPIDLLLTEFHLILLYPNKVHAISTLNNSIVWEEQFPKNNKYGTMTGLAYDPIEKSCWLYGNLNVFELIISNEDRNVWDLYLQKNLYESALQYCKNNYQKDKVWSAQADYYYSTNNFRLAATYYAKTNKSFEEVTLKFISNNDQSALKVYLLNKLDYFRNSNSNKTTNSTQLTLITTWLSEIYLDNLNTLQNNKDAYDSLKEEFEQFLKDYKENLNKSTTMMLISSHGRIQELLYFAELIDDYETVVSYYIQQSNYITALDKMAKQHNEEIYYKYSPILMHYIPRETVNVLLKLGNNLDPRKLIPALMRYEQENGSNNNNNEAIRYLEQIIKKNKDSAIHNYLLSLYAKQKEEGPLLSFLKQNENERYFDLKYAMRLCTKEGKTKASVLIYGAMNLYEEAVELALKVDIELAKLYADKPDEDDTLRKKLWLRIARHLVENENNIKGAMELLTHCNLLKIEDILPFFPDFTRIDDFKQEICSSLEDYNRHIDDLKNEMEEATTSADLIRMDIKELRNKYSFVQSVQKCLICDLPTLSREFYLFPCQHSFHADCLMNQMFLHMDNVQQIRVRDILDQIQQYSFNDNSSVKKVSSSNNNMNSGNYNNSSNNNDDKEVNVTISKVDALKDELDDFIASECLYCGDIMISSISDPFIKPNDLDALSWSI